MKLIALLRKPSIRAPLVFGLGGVAFAGGNLLLARVLSAHDFGLFALVVAIIQVLMSVGPLGAEVVVNRHLLSATPALLRRVLMTTIAATLIGDLIAGALYDLDATLLELLFLGGVGGGANWVASACFQSEQRFGPSLLLNQGANAVILLSVFPAFYFAGGAWLPTAIVVAAYAGMAIGGWSRLLREQRARVAPARRAPFPWREGLASVGIQGASLVMVQGERLITPTVLSIEELATFAALSALVASPFRVLQEGVPHALLPRLRAAATPEQRRRLLARECIFVAAGCAAICAGVWFLTPCVERLLLAEKYVISEALIAVTLAAGVAKVVGSIAATIVNALGRASELRRLSGWSWISALVSLVAGFSFGSEGLVGVVCGVGAGWCLRALAAAMLARRHFAADRSSSSFASELAR